MSSFSMPRSERIPFSSTSCMGSPDSDFDVCLDGLWHYDSVLALESAQTPAETPVALSYGSPFGSLTDHISDGQHDSSLTESFPLSLSTHSLYPLFQMLDQNNDGRVGLDEMMCVLQKLGKELSQSYLTSVIESLGYEGDKALDFAEFTALYQAICGIELDEKTQEERTPQTDAELDFEDFLDTFNFYDKNRDGYICAAELAEVLQDLGFPEGKDLDKCQTLINRVDTDGNGLVDLREFKVMLHRGCAV